MGSSFTAVTVAGAEDGADPPKLNIEGMSCPETALANILGQKDSTLTLALPIRALSLSPVMSWPSS